MARDPDTCDLLCLDLPKAERIRQQLPSREDLGLWAAGAKALGDLSWIVGRDERLVSHHARALKAAGIARSERDGKMVMYELTERGRALLAAVAAQGISAA